MDDYVDQSALELKLCIFNGVPNLEGSGARLFEERRMEVAPRVTVRLGIIGASHIFSLSMGSFHMTEMLACTEPPPFDGYMLKASLGLLASGGLNDEIGMPQLIIPFLSGPLYTFRGTISEADEEAIGDFVTFKDEARRFAAEAPNMIFLEHDFSSHGKGVVTHAFPPETNIRFSWMKDGVALLNTVHTYPNEGKLVETLSTFIIPGFGKHSARVGQFFRSPFKKL